MATQVRILRSIDPSTGAPIEEFEAMGPIQVDEILGRADGAFRDWRGRTFADRATLMKRAATLLRDDSARLAAVITAEMGKPITEAQAEVEKCAFTCDWYAEHAEAYLRDEPSPSDSPHSFVAFAPIGVVLAVMPWNFPLWQVFRFAAPGLMAGNTAVLKHAANVSRCALEIENVLRRAGFPDGAFRTLLIPGGDVSRVIEDPRVRAVTLTGSDSTGAKVAAQAGEHIKKTVLELGGSDAFVVLEDADIAEAAKVGAKSRFQNCGQSCIAAKRFIVVEPVRREFEQRFVEKMKAVRQGDPMDMATEIGPLARHDLREGLHRQVEQSIRRGARCLLGGEMPEGPGAYYPATVLTDVRKGMPAYDQELFGPVAAVIAVRDEAEAIAVANDSSFGLGGAVITRDLARGERIAAEAIESGCVFVNDAVRSDVRLPFGGVKESGYGRELSGYGIREFVNIKTVWVA
jgi:succinate-semialdehyde dehydrogenase / glutarate-semialdehyde dehydrogenase